MSRSVEITIPDMPPKVLRKNARPENRGHQRRVTAEQRARAGEYVMEAISGKDHADYKFERGRVEVVVFWCGKPIDHDGMATGAGPWRDAFIDGGVLPDDSPQYVDDYSITYRRIRHRSEARVTMRIVDTTRGGE